jgi:hypothetical protein
MFADAKIAVFEASKPDIEALPPPHRRRFAEMCRQWADLAEPRSPATNPAEQCLAAGVLLELSRGHRSE